MHGRDVALNDDLSMRLQTAPEAHSFAHRHVSKRHAFDFSARYDNIVTFEEHDYADGFDASYLFKYKSDDVGYAESTLGQALIFRGKLYKLSASFPLGDNHGAKPSEFSPTLAEWSMVEMGADQYFCVSFNFDGPGQSGGFQNVHGGYLLDVRTKKLYYVVRYIE